MDYTLWLIKYLNNDVIDINNCDDNSNNTHCKKNRLFSDEKVREKWCQW